jgi:channel protein (hemolysin III family)
VLPSRCCGRRRPGGSACSCTYCSLLGWAAIWFTGTLLDSAGVAVVALLVAEGVLYNIGAIVYGLCWPNPWPQTFGYHEFFHAFTAAAAICHYIALWVVVLNGPAAAIWGYRV